MKNLFLIYNILFLLVGNVLFSSTHFLHHHPDEHETYECEQCILLDNSSNYISDFQEVNFSNSNSNKFIIKQIAVISLDKNKEYLSRAPPTSK